MTVNPECATNRELTAKVADLERRLAATEALIAGEPTPPRVVEAWAAEAARLASDTRVSDAVRARGQNDARWDGVRAAAADTLGRRDVMGAPHAER